MPRSKSDTVEYFPHVAKPGKTLFILEGQYGNNGYSFWFKLLEILASSEGHFYDVSQELEWNYLLARTYISAQSATEMLNLLANLGNINKQLWKNRKIIWCQALVDNLGEVYRKRKRQPPRKPICDEKEDTCDGKEDKRRRKASPDGIPATKMRQSKVKESKGKKIKDIAPSGPSDLVGAVPFFSCPYFDVDPNYRIKLSRTHPAMSDEALLKEFSKMEDWVSDNKKTKTFKANGHLANPKLFITNWLEKVLVKGQPQTKGDKRAGALKTFLERGTQNES